MMTMATTVDLFREYKRCPEPSALTRLLERHRAGVYAVCLRVLRHSQDAEDACQEVLLKVSGQLNDIEEPGSFAGWLYQTALHTSLDLRRKRERHRARIARVEAGAGAAEAPSVDIEALQRGLAGLDETSRDLIVEHYLARRSLRDLAQERGCSSVAVWKRIRNARERLRRTIGSASMLALEIGGKAPVSAALLGGWMSAKASIALAVAAPLLLIGVAAAAFSNRHVDPPSALVKGAPTKLRSAAVTPTNPVAAQELPKPAAVRPAERKPTASVRKPYPFKLDPTSLNPAARTWATVRSSRISLDLQGSMLDIAREVQRQTGLLVRIDARHEADSISFKVGEVLVDGCLRLLLQPRNMDYEIRPDGTIFCGPREEIAGGYELIGRRLQTDEYALAQVRTDLDGGWDGIESSTPRKWTADTLRTKSLVLRQGMTTWDKEIERVKEATGLTVLLDLPMARGASGSVIQPKASKPFLQAVEEQSAAAIIDRCAGDLGLVPCIREDGIVYLTTKDKAQEITRKAQETDAATLDFIGSLSHPVRGSGSVHVSDFLDSIMLGLPVLPTEEVWNSSATVNVTPGLSIRQALDQLKAQGIRCGARDGKVYVLK